MSFESGSRLGPYEIVAPIGAGGMGEVYRARDTRLDRTVAVKVLSRALAADSESRRRFEEEARAIAALNDPHICTIHDVGRHGDLDYLVLEFLEGETLADRIRRSAALADRRGAGHRRPDWPGARSGTPCRHRPSRSQARQRDAGAPRRRIGTRREAARFRIGGTHERGRAKALDASLIETMAPSMVATKPPTATVSSGFSGTLQYMSPEQLDGDPGDHRADIFAFGCVFYEMLAGRKPFEGQTAVTVIAAIMSTEPAPIAALASAHPLVDHLMRRCLEKDRDQRWQSIGDVARQLRWIAANPVAAPTTAPPSRFNRRYRTAALTFRRGHPQRPDGGGARALIGNRVAPELPTLRLEITTPPTDDPTMAMTPDGTQIAFVANQNRVPMLWVRSLDSSRIECSRAPKARAFRSGRPTDTASGFSPAAN
jgi:serine/threonine-protein kinase